jgi:hypothetical protein
MEFWDAPTSAWTILQSGYTDGLQFGYANFNDVCYYGNGTDDFTHWSGGVTHLAAALTGSEATIAVDDTTGFSAYNHILTINATTVQYSGVNTTAFLNCTGAPATADEAVVFQNVTESPSLAKGNKYAIHNFRLNIANELSLNYSAVDDPLDMAGGGVSTFPDGGDPIRSLESLENSLIVFKENSVWQYTWVSGSPVKTEIVKFQNAGCGVNNATVVGDNDVLFVSPDNNIRSLGREINYDGLRVDYIGDAINGTTKNMDMSEARMFFHNKKLYVAGKNRTGDAFNNVVLVYDMTYKAWSRYTGMNIGGAFVYEDNLYFGSSNDDNTHKALDGWTDNGAAVASYWQSKQFTYALPHEAKKMRWLYLEGYISTATTLYVDLTFDDTPARKQTVEISGTGAVSYTHLTLPTILRV